MPRQEGPAEFHSREEKKHVQHRIKDWLLRRREKEIEKIKEREERKEK
ncbi:MAG: hypothetical protein AAB440_02880 [Patescibacteria group bacterium]